MLPPFRVKQLVPSEISEPGRRSTGLADGVVKMSREAYDALLQRNPQAALNYIDEEDGDVIMVSRTKAYLTHRFIANTLIRSVAPLSSVTVFKNLFHLNHVPEIVTSGTSSWSRRCLCTPSTSTAKNLYSTSGERSSERPGTGK